MPLYEYVCSDCNIKFDKLLPVGRMNEPASCPQGHSGANRVLSMFAAVTTDAFGEAMSVGGGGCGGCGDSCACSAN